MQKIKYFTVERIDSSVEDILRKMRRDLGPIRLFAYNPLVELGGNIRILELKKTYGDDLMIKVDGPEFLMKELHKYFFNGGKV